jgi:type VI secretion system protein ImpA
VRDILLLQGKPTPGPDLRSQAEIETIIREAGAHKLVFVSEAKAAREEVGKIQLLLKNDRSGKAVAKDDTSTGSAPDLDALARMLTNVVQFCERLLTLADESGAGAQPVPGDQPSSGITSAGSKSIDVIRSREDAARLLDKVCEFIERTEPSNPAPLFIRRAQKLMVKNFVEIIQELAPESLAPIKKMTGLEK